MRMRGSNQAISRQPRARRQGEDGREGDARDGVRRATYDDARPFGETGDSGGETEGAGGAGGSRGELEKRERRRTRDAGSERVGGVWK